MTITKCDRCLKDIPSMNELIIVQMWPWTRPGREKRFELCEECRAELIKWIDKEQA